MFKVLFYESADGNTPVEDSLLLLPPKLRAKMLEMMRLLAEKGPALRRPYTDHVRDGIFELRAIQGTNIARALFFFEMDRIIIITNVFVKKQQKLPEKEIKLAVRRRADYQDRFASGRK